jgi:arginase
VTDDNGRRDWDLFASPWHLDEPIDRFPIPDHAITLAGPAPQTPALRSMLDHYRLIADATARARRPLILAGDCLTAVGVLAGLQRRCENLAIVWLDAHGDFNNLQTTTSGYLAGMALAMLTGHCPRPFCEPLALRPVPDRNVVLADARDLDPAERDALNASQIEHVAVSPHAIQAALARLRAHAIYLHIDVDVINGAELPGLRFPTGGGPNLDTIEQTLSDIVTTVEPAAACIACAWLPEQIASPTTYETVARIAGAIGAELRWPREAGNQSPATST